MKYTNAQSIASVLNDLWEQNPTMADKMAETRLITYWNTMSPAITRYTADLFVKNRTLYVSLTSAVLKHELLMRREQLCITLNRAVGRNVIDTIVFH